MSFFAAYRYALIEDLEELSELDWHISKAKLLSKISREEYIVLTEEDNLIGFIRFGYFWDEHPFMNMLFVYDRYRSKGYGREIVLKWEEDMKSKGYKVVMTSTQADEYAQHFYRKLGYKDIGGFTFPSEVLELILVKELM